MDLSSVLGLIQTALELGLICSVTVLALYLSCTMLNVCDLSTDGCFTLGAVTGAVTAMAGHPILAIFAAMAAGLLSGLIVSVLQTRMGINSLLAGIIVNTALYSINIAIMGGASLLSLNKTQTVFSLMKSALAGTPLAGQYKLLTALAAAALIVLFLTLFLRTRMGLAIRATGNNPDMVRYSSINPVFTITVGLCIANALTAFSGALVGQSQRSANVNIGTGMVVIGLACLIIGETVLGRGSMLRGALSVFVGSILYRIIYAAALSSRIIEAMKLLTAILVALAIAAPTLKQWAAFQKRKAEMRKGGR